MTPRTPIASTVPEPHGKPGGPGAFRIKGAMYPPYIEHVAGDLMKDHPESQAYEMAIGIVRNWAHGHDGHGHKVSAQVQAAAAKAIAEYDALRARAKAIPNKGGRHDLASRNGRHIPGTPYEWKHGYIPLTHAAALLKAHGHHAAAERLFGDHGEPNPHAMHKPPAKTSGRLLHSHLSVMSDDDLAGALNTDDEQQINDVLAEFDRREKAAKLAAQDQLRTQLREQPPKTDAERDDLYEQLIDTGADPEDAFSEVYGVGSERQRKDAAIAQLRAAGFRGAGFDQLSRDAFKQEAERQYFAAEDETRGNVLNAAGKAAKIDPISLFSGPETRARKYASEELMQWWQDHGRLTHENFINGLLGHKAVTARGGYFA